MEARPAVANDAGEIVRLARLMFESMGIDLSDATWEEEGRRHVRGRIGGDVAVFVVDDPIRPARLVASAAGVITRRLPTPSNEHGLVGYVQWVCTDHGHRRRGLARQVMSALLTWFEANDVAAVELHSTAVAESLYLSMGFDDSGSRALRRRARPPSAPASPAAGTDSCA